MFNYTHHEDDPSGFCRASHIKARVFTDTCGGLYQQRSGTGWPNGKGWGYGTKTGSSSLGGQGTGCGSTYSACSRAGFGKG